MSDEYGLLDTEMSDTPGDEWEEIDVSDTESDRIARQQDREFLSFRKRIKDADQFKVEASVFDDATFAAIYKLVQDGYIDAFGGPVSTGKEASVYTARGDSETVAVKIYRINASDFQQMRAYLDGDPRFSGIGNDKKKVVLSWVRKEFSNLQRAHEAGVRVPKPITTERNVLVMEYVGNDTRALRLAEVEIENPQTAYEVVREYTRRLYAAGLVHGDLSEYNLVIHDSELYVIDLGQAVTIHHPNSREFLERDCHNVARFFSQLGVNVTGDELLEHVIRDEQTPDVDPAFTAYD
ncbi:serine/threonine-protein kinase Rio1 [Halocatena pleomorpha]|uniref:non-specific serine/threonine protein kinase n=1 Tax=Halocatena pleomorpha TaxID=1785090 RepID=A0A3P3RCU0_9EURY|nr:serine/threonine-protein kinase Rio1 [Halocatena pleomorpha]RRJ30779.1 serine protein kinase RIO [Halocatena pleomorpha]